MSIPKNCDVVIVGGGPAGSSAACALRKKGYDVVLFDKVRHPRFIVGESLLPHIWKYFDLMGVSEAIEKEGFLAKKGGTVIWNGEIRQLFFSDFGFERPGLNVERDRLDYLLLQQARLLGTQVFEEVTVKKVDLENEQSKTVHYHDTQNDQVGEINCRYVIDASGQSALLSRQMKGRRIDEDFRFVSIWGYFNDSKYIAAGGEVCPFEMNRQIAPTTFVTSLSQWGWAWHIPLREKTSVGLVIPLDEFKRAKVADNGMELESFFLQTCRETPYLNNLLDNAEYNQGSLNVIRDYSYVPHKLAGPGYYIAGDAAAFVDPIFSLGLVLALASGNLAAWSIDRALVDSSKAASSMDIYKNYYSGWYEVARSMALPGKELASNRVDLASTFMEFQSDREKDLLYAAGMLTTRSSNFVRVTADSRGERLSEKLHVLNEIKM